MSNVTFDTGNTADKGGTLIAIYTSLASDSTSM